MAAFFGSAFVDEPRDLLRESSGSFESNRRGIYMGKPVVDAPIGKVGAQRSERTSGADIRQDSVHLSNAHESALEPPAGNGPGRDWVVVAVDLAERRDYP